MTIKSDSQINAEFRARATALLDHALEGAGLRITVNPVGSVGRCEGGAFVECSLWVPDPPIAFSDIPFKADASVPDGEIRLQVNRD